MSNNFDVMAGKLAENEKSLSDLYALFAQTFPEDAALWTEMSHDEERHAAWITEVRQAAHAGTTAPAPTSVRSEAIETMTRYVRSLGERCRKGGMSRIQAHSLAQDLENSMLENRLFEALGLASAEFRTLQEGLIRETTRHRQTLKSALDTLRAAR